MVKISTQDIVDILTNIANNFKQGYPKVTMESVLEFIDDLNRERARMPDDMRMSIRELTDDLELFTKQKFKGWIDAQKFFDNTVMSNYAARLANTGKRGLQMAADRIVKGIKAREAKRVMESL